jgi:hypothetical protein
MTITSFSCVCRGGGVKENSESEQGITIRVDSDAPLLHHILKVFNPEIVSEYYVIGAIHGQLCIV